VKRYSGRAPHEVFVNTSNGDTRPLYGFQGVRNHSPTGFSWGYGGSGPAQLALAICIDCVGRHRALEVYQAFKWDVIAKLPGDRDWELTETQVRAQIEDYERELARAGTVRA
jgi:hypothetical protein